MAAFAVALLALVAGANAAPFIGGASSIRSLVLGLGAKCAGFPGYDSQTSGTGIAGFNNGTYLIGASDQPMSAAQDAIGISAAPGKCTIPLVLATFGFYVRGPSPSYALKMGPKETYGNYSSATATWPASIPVIGGKKVVRVARNEASGSGTTLIIKLYWINGKTTFKGAADGSPFNFTGLVGAAGTSAMCSTVNMTIGAIGYAQAGICEKSYPGLNEVALLNSKSAYIKPSASLPSQAVPAKLPAYCKASWATVGSSMVLASSTNSRVPAMASFEYSFIKRSSVNATAKSVLRCLLTAANNLTLVNSFGFQPSTLYTSAFGNVSALV